jgi:hypothetical protein
MPGLSKRANAAPAPTLSGTKTEPRSLTNVLDHVAAAIAPFYDDGTSVDPAASRLVARQSLLGYNAANAGELQLAAQIAAFGMAALDCLRCAMTERDMPVDTLLRIQSHAIKLNTLSDKHGKVLDRRQRDRINGVPVPPDASCLDDAAFQASIGKAREMVAYARTKLEAHRVGKALAAETAAASAVVAKSPVPPVLAAPMTAAVLAHRQTAEEMWARDLKSLLTLDGQTRH